ncbi:MAG: hypothetical protein M3Y49_16600 [Actinomycetota bacterium]|nr:hypothetical protein [Actinomycetota bacterium]
MTELIILGRTLKKRAGDVLWPTSITPAASSLAIRWLLSTHQGTVDQPNLWASNFTPVDFNHVDYFLDAPSTSLSTAAPQRDSVAAYDAESESESESGQADFVIRVDEPTDFVGYPRARPVG